MAKRVWQEIKIQNCEHAGGAVALEAEVLYPDDTCPTLPRGWWRTAAHAAWNAA